MPPNRFHHDDTFALVVTVKDGELINQSKGYKILSAQGAKRTALILTDLWNGKQLA
jgi:hypothetical protein